MWNTVVILQSKISAGFTVLTNKFASAINTSNRSLTVDKTTQILAVLTVQSNKLSSIIATSNKNSDIRNVTNLVAIIVQGIFVIDREFTDTAAATDTGRIFFLSYADAGYFSEEYVGSISTF